MRSTLLTLSAENCAVINPVLPGDHPDPSVIRVGQHYWACSTSGEWSPQFPLFHSTDLKAWEPAGHILAVQPPWADGAFWAPELVHDRGRFVVYYVARARGGSMTIAAATAPAPQGPWTDRGPLIAEPLGSIDPAFTRDEHGRPHLVWKTDGNSQNLPTPIWAQPLSPDLLHLTGSPTELITNDQPWEGDVVEGAYVMRHAHRFYMFYAGNACCGRECKYAEGVARAEHLLGPWTKWPGNPLINGNDKWRCPGHGTAVHGLGMHGKRGQDYLLYHAYPSTGTVFVGREAMLDRIVWGEDGWPAINAGHGPHVNAELPAVDFTDEFNGPALGASWQWPVNTHPTVRTDVLAGGGLVVRIPAGRQSAMLAVPIPGVPSHDAMVLLDLTATGETRLGADPVQPATPTYNAPPPSLWAGLAVVGDPFNTIGLGVREGKLQVWQRCGAEQHISWSQAIGEGIDGVWLRVQYLEDAQLQFFFRVGDGPWTAAGELVDGSPLPAWDRGLRIGLMLEGPGAVWRHFSTLPCGHTRQTCMFSGAGWLVTIARAIRSTKRRVAAFLCLPAGLVAGAQGAHQVCVTDTAHQPLSGVAVATGSVGLQTGADGCALVLGDARNTQLQLAGFASRSLSLRGARTNVALLRVGSSESVTVYADRAFPGINDSASSVAVLGSEALAAPPALTLDDRLHSVAGFQLFRRTSSWTANPTSQGVSLRGLGSTAASRTLVVSDQVPLNDPFGGWIHWNEVPPLAIQQVELVRGGSSDLYGSSAIGGVIDLVPVTASPRAPLQLKLDASGATENSSVADGLLASSVRGVSFLAAGNEVRTGGYVPTAPFARGVVDAPANVAAETGRLELRAAPRPGVSAFLRGNVLNEARVNGTLLQTNGTRLWRYVGGGDLTHGESFAVLRLFGSRETYRQSFSSIAADRNSERLTRLQAVPDDEFGFVASGSHAFPHELSAALGVDMRDVRATDRETPVSNNVASPAVNISARQRETGGYADAIWQPQGWSVSASVRADSFRTFDARQTTASGANNPASPEIALPEIDELIASPRVGLVWRPGVVARRVPRGLAFTVSAFRAFRGPTMNELYRTGQVGQQTTLPNNSLQAERATGFEWGGEYTHARLGHLRATYFWTEVNRPVSAVLLTQTATAQTLQRQNLGQICSRGLMLEAASERHRGFDASVGYQLAVATVTRFNTASVAQRNLTGNWIPQVPRQALTATLNYRARRVAEFHLSASYTGQQFDDAENLYRLRPYARFDLQAERRLPHGFSLFGGAQNLLNRTTEAGRTPLLTLASPRLVQAGVRYSFSR